jgi:hypothetical protein
MRPISAFGSTPVVYKNVPKNPQVDTVGHESFADIQELAAVPAIAPQSHRCYM